MPLLIIALILAGGSGAIVATAWWRVRRWHRRSTIADVAAWLRRLLREHARGSVLIAEPNARGGFLQFALTQRRGARRTIELGLPDCAWSQKHFADVQDALDSAGIRWTVEAVDVAGPVRRYLRAELSGDHAQVLRIADDLIPRLASAMGYPQNETYRVSLRGGEAPEYAHELAGRFDQMASRGARFKVLAALLRPRSGRTGAAEHAVVRRP